jgi:hypothetical protein
MSAVLGLIQRSPASTVSPALLILFASLLS